MLGFPYDIYNIMLLSPYTYHEQYRRHLNKGENQVAVWLAEGRSVDEIARATGRANNTIYWYLKPICQKLPISRQAALVRFVLSVAEL